MIDTDALVAWMDDEGLPGKGEALEHGYISGGSQNEIYEVRRGELHGALRIPPPSAPESRDEVLAHYSQASGRQVDDIDYYMVLAKWKLAVVLEQGFQRAGDDEKLLAFGPVVLDLMAGAAELAETTDYRS